jgi:16S rRNA (guanine(966)-N(2))-methyltransferase RsmD
VRVVSGELGGRRFSPPSKMKARPTTDIAKEGLFNVLRNIIDFSDISVLDLFSGTGSISYEFASRGAKDICSVEIESKNIVFIKKTSEIFKIKNHDFFRADAFRFLEKTNKQYNVIFADPPYQSKRIEELPKIVFDRNLLKEEGVFVLEHSKDFSFSDNKAFLQQRSYGGVCFSIFQR